MIKTITFQLAMNHKKKTKAQLLAELQTLRQELARLQAPMMEQDQAEVPPLKSEDRFRIMTETAPVMIWISGLDAQCLFFNKPWLDFTGRTMKEEIGSGWTASVHPSDLEHCLDTYSSAFQSRQNFRMEYRLKRADSQYRWLSAAGTPWYSPNGDFAGYIGSCIDITERKQEEITVRQNEERFQLIAQAAADLLYDWDIESGKIWRNEGYRRLLGQTPLPESGLDWWQVRIHPDDRTAILSSLQVALDGEEQFWAGQYRFWCDANGYTYVQDKGHIIRNAAGVPVRMVGAVTDISRQKKLEEALRTSEERYRNLFENANDGLAIVNLDRSVVAINSAMEKLLGWSREELIGQDYHLVLTPAGRALAKERELRLQAGKKVPSVFEHEFLRKDGGTVWVEGRTRFIRDQEGIPIGFQGVYRDISERRQAQEELRRSQQQYQALVDSIDGIVWELDMATFQFTFVSPQAERLLGYPVERWFSEPDFWQNHIHPEDQEWAVNFCLAQTKKKQKHQFEYRMLTADGRVLWVHDLVSIAVENGQPAKLRGVITDITARKQAEKELQASEQRFQAFMTNSPLFAFVKDKAGRLEYINSTFIHAFDFSTVEWQGKTDAELWPPVLAQRLRENDLAVLSSGSARAGEETVIQADGEHQWLTWKFPFHDSEGNLLLGGMGIDITERKRMETSLRASEERFKAYYQELPMPTYTWQRIGEDFVLINYNNAAYQLTDGAVADLRGKTASELYHDEPQILEEMQRCLVEHATLQREMLYRLRTKQQLVEFLTTYVFVPPDLVMVHTEDIRKRKQTERQLQAERNFALQIMTAMGQGLVVTNTNHQIDYINPALSQLLGYTEKEILGKLIIDVVHPKHYDLLLQMRERVRHKETINIEISLQHADGRILPALATCSLRWRDNKEEGIILVFTDLAEQKRAEEERQRLQAQLQQAQKLEAIGVLAGGVAHDFNNILAAMMGGVELALDDVPPLSRANENLSEALKAGQRAKVLLEQLLTFSRPTHGERRPLQLQSLIEDSLRFLRSSLPKTVRLLSDLSCSTETVFADPIQLQQVMMNLCLNSAQAMQDRPGAITIRLQRLETENPERRGVTGLTPGPYLLLTVSDTGCGIAPEIQPQVFDPFFTTRPVGQGTGLGLAVVHSIVTAHGGIVTVESQLGQGATFCVYLPITKAIASRETRAGTCTALPLAEKEHN